MSPEPRADLTASQEPGAGPRILIVEARFYDEIADMLLAGARRALAQAGARVDLATVPGALEIPAAIRLAVDSGRFDAYVALGCVIQGETRHYDIVAGESARGLTELALRHGALIGNGILTTENGSQARLRADPDGKDKGGDAARAALALLKVQSWLRG
jgi:6,7-dimethyl-8-ribityllumazine synthase